MKNPLYPKAELLVSEATACLGNESGPVGKSTKLSTPNVFISRRLNSPSAAKRTLCQYPIFSITGLRRNMVDDIFGKIYFPGVPRRYKYNYFVKRACSDVFAIIFCSAIKIFFFIYIFFSFVYMFT